MARAKFEVGRGMDNLPAEMAIEILKYLSLQDLLAMSLVSPRMRFLCNNDTLWHIHFTSYFPDAVKGDAKNYKEAFQHEYRRILRIATINRYRFNIDTPENLRGSYFYALKCAKKNRSFQLQLARNGLNGEFEIVLEVMKHTGSKLQYTTSAMQDNLKIVRAAIKQNPLALAHASERLKDNEVLVAEAMQKNGLAIRFASPRLKNTEQIAIIAVQQNYRSLGFLKELKNNESVVYAALANWGGALQYASKRLRDNADIVKFALSSSFGVALKYASKRLQDNEEVVRVALENSSYAIEYVSDRLKNNDTIVRVAINAKGRGGAIIFASQRLQENRVMALLAAKNLGLRKYSSNDKFPILPIFCNDREIMLAAIQEGNNAFIFASEDLKCDTSFIIDAVTKDPKVIKYINKDLPNYHDIVLACVKANARTFFYISPDLYSNYSIVLAAVQKLPYALTYINPSMSDYSRIVNAVVDVVIAELTTASIECIHEKLCDHSHFMYALAVRDIQFLVYASDRLKGDFSFMLRIANRNKFMAGRYATATLRANPTFQNILNSRAREIGLFIHYTPCRSAELPNGLDGPAL